MRDLRNLLRPALFPLCGLLLLFVLPEPMMAQAATYYVATTGSDSNPGTSSSPWRNLQRCTRSPIKAGDTCIARAGTYTDTDGSGTTLYVDPNAPAGTSSLPITIKSETQLGAVIIIPSTHANNVGVYITRPYYIIQGFDITGGNKAGAGNNGITFQPTATGSVARLNSIHHIGRSVCSNSGIYNGVLVGKVSGIVVERNRFYSIGRRRNGESGCSTSVSNLDHGVYVAGPSNLVIRRNVFYDVNRGYPIHVYGATTTNLSIYHNTLSGKSPTGTPMGQIMLASTISGATIRNNISHNPATAMIATHNLSASNVNVSYNLGTAKMKGVSSIGGVTFSSNFENIANLGFVNSTGNDFRLTSSSYAINRGTSSGVPLVPDGAPDIAAYEYSVQNNISSPLTPTGLRSM